MGTGAALQKHRFFSQEENWPKWLEGATHYLAYADTLRVLDDEYRAGNGPMKSERDSTSSHAAFNCTKHAVASCPWQSGY